MTFGDTIRLALRNLGQSKLRTTLTTLGVSIGIASLAGMVSLGVGLQDQFVGRFTRSGVFDSITVMPGGLPRGRGPFAQLGPRGGRRGRGAAAPSTPPPPLDDDAVKQIAAIGKVKDVYPNLRVPVEISLRDFSELVVATGVPMSSRDEGAFRTFASGGFFSSESDAACLLTLEMAKRIDDKDPKALVGQALTLSYAVAAPAGSVTPPVDVVPGVPLPVRRVDTTCRIAGIVERDPTPGPGAQLSGLMIPLAKAREIASTAVTNAPSMLRDPGQKRPYQTLTVKVAHAQDTQDVEDRIKTLGYNAFSVNDALEGAKRAFIILDIVLSLIGSIALAVSSLGIVNTMVMSILERTREIGIMKAIGGSDADIRRIFLIEASAIGLLGGLVGVVLGWVVGRLINFGANVYIQNQGGTAGNLFSLPWWLIGGAIGFSIVVSLIAGSYPANRAARLDPIQALRHD